MATRKPPQDKKPAPDTPKSAPRAQAASLGQTDKPADGAHEFSALALEQIEGSARLNAPMIYETLRREGEEEMDRPTTSLWWSGVAAGLSISFSLIAQAVLQSHLPDAPWRPLITGFGYTVGFLIAVLARHQLFTENTITAVLPVAAALNVKNLLRMGRLWGLVLVANLAGTLIAALFCTFTPVLTPDLHAAMLDISQVSLANPPVDMFLKAVVAGFLIACMVWLLPNAGPSQFHVIVLMTYIVAIGGFAHIVAGSFESFMLMAAGRLTIWPMLAGFVAPTLFGNIVGGTVLFSLISYGQVAKEM